MPFVLLLLALLAFNASPARAKATRVSGTVSLLVEPLGFYGAAGTLQHGGRVSYRLSQNYEIEAAHHVAKGLVQDLQLFGPEYDLKLEAQTTTLAFRHYVLANFYYSPALVFREMELRGRFHDYGKNGRSSSNEVRAETRRSDLCAQLSFGHRWRFGHFVFGGDWAGVVAVAHAFSESRHAEDLSDKTTRVFDEAASGPFVHGARVYLGVSW